MADLVAGETVGKQVTFGDLYTDDIDSEESEFSESSGEESFYEITTSERESLSSSDENNAEELEMVLHSAYTCSPQKFRSDPVLRNSLLLWDKDLLDSDEGMTVSCPKTAFALVLNSCFARNPQDLGID